MLRAFSTLSRESRRAVSGLDIAKVCTVVGSQWGDEVRRPVARTCESAFASACASVLPGIVTVSMASRTLAGQGQACGRAGTCSAARGLRRLRLGLAAFLDPVRCDVLARSWCCCCCCCWCWCWCWCRVVVVVVVAVVALLVLLSRRRPQSTTSSRGGTVARMLGTLLSRPMGRSLRSTSFRAESSTLTR
jgi:hypothetical protein